MQRYRVPCRIVRAGNAVGFNLKNKHKNVFNKTLIHKGQSAALSIGNPEKIAEKLRKVFDNTL